MKINPKIDEDYNKLINIQTNNIEIIKLYSEFVEGVLYDEEKLEKCQNNSKVIFNSKIEIREKDFSNFDIKILNEKNHLPYLILSTSKGHLGIIIDFSMNILKIFGYTKDELIGHHINILIPKIFHKIHDSMFLEQYENDKLKLFDELNKKKIYFPNFIQKVVYGIAKNKLLIELNVFVYFVKTEENGIVYIIEIENFNPIVLDLTKNVDTTSKYCVLTDENFLIQTFTPNCLEFLKLNYSDINSNLSIINYIKQFKDDYLTVINNTEISKYSHINKTELILEEKNSEQKNIKNSIPPKIRKKIKNDLFIKKYSKKCKITWKINYDNIRSSNIFKSRISYNNSVIKKDSKNSILNPNKKIYHKIKNGIEKNIYMEIEKIIIKKELLGYYFFFSKIKNKISNNNMSFIKEDDNINETDDYLTKIKKYQCKIISESEINIINSSKLEPKHSGKFSSLILKPFKKRDNGSNFRKLEKKKSLDKNSKVNFRVLNEKNSMKKSSFATKSSSVDNGDIITGDFVPQCSSHFLMNLEKLCFMKSNQNDYDDDDEYLEILKKEAKDKINLFKEQLKLLSKDSDESYDESEEYESDEEPSFYSFTSMNSSDSNSLYKNLQKEKKNSFKTEIVNQTPKLEKRMINDNKKIIENNNVMNAYLNSKRGQKKNSIIINYYKVNLTKIHYMVYDFYKDMIVEGNKDEIALKMESILANQKNTGSLNIENDERFSLISMYVNNNKKKKENKESKTKDNNINLNKKTSLYEEKSFKIKIHEALNKHKDEPPIIKLKIFNILCYFIFITYGTIILINNVSILSNIDKTLYLIKNIISIKYCSQISSYYFREMTLLNFVVNEIKGGVYYRYPSKDKEEYKLLIDEQIKALFIESQSSLKTIYSTIYSFNQKSSKILSEISLYIKISNFPKIDMEYDIFTIFMQYSSSFYNLISSAIPLEQNNTDLCSFIYNNLDGYKNGFDIMFDIYKEELRQYLNKLYIVLIGTSCLIFIILAAIYYFVIRYFLSAIRTRGNYMKVFYGINEKILKNLIDNCQNLMNKLKSSEEIRFYEEDTLNESLEEKIKIEDNKKNQNNQFGQNLKLNYDNDNRANNKISHIGISFVIFYGIFLLISYTYFIYNCIYLIKSSKNSISISDFCYMQQNFHLSIIEYYNIYREFLFDNQSIIKNISSSLYIIKYEKEKVSKLNENTKYLRINSRKFLQNEKESEKSLCSYYINDFFDSSVECEETIGLISHYQFEPLTFNFLQEIKINRNIIKYKLEFEEILGNLTEYNFSDYINNQYIQKNENDSENNSIFRLDLFNDVTLHHKLNVIFFSIILPYIQEKRKNIYNILTIGRADNILIISFILFAAIVTLLYLFYFIPIINYINRIIYKTKNMLSIIPLSVLSCQSGVSKLLNISNEN